MYYSSWKRYLYWFIHKQLSWFIILYAYRFYNVHMLPFNSLRPPNLFQEFRKYCKGLISATLDIDLKWSNGFNRLNSKADYVMLRYANWLPGTFKRGVLNARCDVLCKSIYALVEHLFKFWFGPWWRNPKRCDPYLLWHCTDGFLPYIYLFGSRSGQEPTPGHGRRWFADILYKYLYLC